MLGIGGGVVCDITGLVATLYMRGLNFGYVATSLLCQVDASVGGKNGINFNKLVMPCGHYTVGKYFFKYIDGYLIYKFFKDYLK